MSLLFTPESTTTPIGLNQRILSFVSTFSSPPNEDASPPKIEKVRTTRTIAVTLFSNIFLVNARKSLALFHIDLLLLIFFSPKNC